MTESKQQNEGSNGIVDAAAGTCKAIECNERKYIQINIKRNKLTR